MYRVRVDSTAPSSRQQAAALAYGPYILLLFFLFVVRESGYPLRSLPTPYVVSFVFFVVSLSVKAKAVE